MKYFIYVEGLLEAYFLKQLLHFVYDYDPLKYGFRIISDNRTETVEEDQCGDPSTSSSFYTIRIVGGDERVTSLVKENIANQTQNGFIVLGLRDVYSQGYQELFKRRRPGVNLNYEAEIVEEFIQKVLQSLSSNFDFDFEDVLIFQQMEIEAWLIGLIHFNPSFDFSLSTSVNYISDPSEIYHPAAELERKLLELRKIDGEWKRSSNYNRIISQLNKFDFESLYLSDFCIGFKMLFEKLGLDNC